MGKESVEYLHHTIEIEVGPNEVHGSALQRRCLDILYSLQNGYRGGPDDRLETLDKAGKGSDRG